MKKLIPSLLFFGFVLTTFNSCFLIRRYDTPEYVEIETNETAFIVDLFQDDEITLENQVNENPEKNYKAVNQKLVKIPHTWKKNGQISK